MLKIPTYRKLEAALADGGAPAGSPAAGTPPASSTPPASGTPPDDTSGDASKLAGAAPGQPAANAMDWLQSKYHVKKADGTLDEAASIRKQAEAYAPLVKKLGSDEARPDKPEDYKLAAPAEVDEAAWNEFVGDTETKQLIQDAHAQGLNNKQMQWALEKALGLADTMVLANAAERDAATKSYMAQNGWSNDSNQAVAFNAVQGAVAALSAKTGISIEAFTSPLKLADGVVLPPAINDPRIVKILQTLAPELRTGDHPAQQRISATEVESLMKSTAYFNKEHPDHESVKQRVTAHFQNMPNAGAKARGPFVMQTG